MKFDSLIPSRLVLAFICGIALAAGVVAIRARADQWDQKTILTVNQPIQIRDTYLQPGKYVLKLLDSQADRHIVQIFNGDETHIINTVLAIPSERLEPSGRTRFTFWETPPGTVKALRDWYYPGETIGNEFPYPKHLQQVAMAQPPAPAPPPPAPVASNPQPETPAHSEPMTPEPAPAPEVAQNTPPAQPAPPAQTEEPKQLPKTGSPYPLIGFAGALMIGLSGLLRLLRKA
ncbi:MAG TPA: LPXTG cell wall anchor domain-containing protein [Bryobacteraceae bacterium]|nr:LPXTG cell wall anchor domain-containing protein [Bryobacteraceae bacterium]